MSSRREINGNSTLNGKRKTSRDRRHTGPVNFKCSGYSSLDPMNNIPYYPNNQNMIPALSDPSLCYPFMNYQMPYEPHSLPTYHPTYQPLYRNYNHSNQCGLVNNPPAPQINYFKNNSQQCQDSSDQEFTSLPVVNSDLTNGDNKRRFSDPGIPNDCDTDDSCSKNDQIVQCLIEQVNYLKDSNRRLYRELQEMRSEMTFLKQQFGAKFYEKDYEPGMLSDIVREIRDAARVREEALLSRVKHMIEERQLTMNHLQLVAEKARNNDRLGKLEEQMKTLRLSNSHREDGSGDMSSISTDQVLELEQINLELRRELQEARASKKDADARVIHLDQMLTSMNQKYSNGCNGGSGDHLSSSFDDVKIAPPPPPTTTTTTTSTTITAAAAAATTTVTTTSIDNCSLTTKSASPVARVVMSGPVTSL